MPIDSQPGGAKRLTREEKFVTFLAIIVFFLFMMGILGVFNLNFLT